MSCRSWGPIQAIGQSMNHEQETLHIDNLWRYRLLKYVLYMRIKWLQFYESPQCLLSVARIGRQHLSVTEVQCPQRRAEPETGTADGSLQQRGATVRGWPYQGCLMLHELSSADSRSQNNIPSLFHHQQAHIKRHLNQPKVYWIFDTFALISQHSWLQMQSM